MGGVITEEQDICQVEYLDVDFSKLGTLYDLSLHAPHPTSDPSRPSTEALVDGVLGSVQTQPAAKPLKKKNQSLGQANTNEKTTPPHVSSNEVNSIQSSESS